jgi:hypothetical protein
MSNDPNDDDFDLDEFLADSDALLDEDPYAVVTLDRARGDELPSHVKIEDVGVEISMYLGWAIDTRLVSDELETRCQPLLDQFRARTTHSREILSKCCDNKLEIPHLSDKGNEFTRCYYRPGWSHFYYEDLGKRFPDLDDFAYLADTWENYDIVRDMIHRRFEEWMKEDKRRRS